MINIVIKRLAIMIMIILGIAVIGASHAYAVDPPHNDTSTDTWWCTKCHTLYGVGTALKTPKGNSARCLSCHTTTGMASNKPFTEADEAVPGTSGIYHRWDSGPGGYITSSTPGGSTGYILSGIVYTWNDGDTVTNNLKNIFFNGSVPRVYEIKITTEGNIGTAQFQWRSSDNSGTTWTAWSANQATATSFAFADGNNLKVSFVNGLSPSFKLNDTWTVKVRPQINYPFTYFDNYANLTKKMFKDTGAPNDILDVDTTSYTYPASTYGKASCSTCHNQHYQTNMSNDPFSPSTYDSSVPFSDGAGRHYQRIPNQQNELCLDCHSKRNINTVRTWTGNKLSHPVGVDFPSVNTSTHSVPKEYTGVDQSNKATSGKATATTNTTCLTDTAKDWTNTSNSYYNPTNLYVYLLGSGLSKQITSYTATQVCWASGALSITSGHAYVIDADGNPTNNFRFYDSSAGKASFVQGKVYCLTCHGIHWADSDQLTYDEGQ